MIVSVLKDVGALRKDGSIALAGAWDMGSQAVTNANIDSGNIANAVINAEWDAAYSWGDHALAGYLTVEVDPIFSASAAVGIMSGDITNWNTAYAHSQLIVGNPHQVTPAELSLVIGTDVQAFHVNLMSLSVLVYASVSFVKMTAADTFALDTNTYSLSNHLHNGDTLQHDAVNSDGGAFGFTTTGTVTFNQKIYANNFEFDDTNQSTSIGTNAEGVLLAGVTSLGYSASKGNTKTYVTTIGHSAGLDNTGAGQTAIGHNAGNTNSGASQTVFGFSAGFQNSGASQTAFGSNAGFQNTGANQTAFGNPAGYANTGANQTALGRYAGYKNSATDQSVFGSYSGHFNTGIWQSCYGSYSGQRNTGSYLTAFGPYAGQYNDGDYNSALGYNAFNTFVEDAGSAVTFDNVDVDTANNRVTIVGHGIGAIGTYHNLKFTEGSAPLPILVDGTVYLWKVINANTLELLFDLMIQQGTGVGHKLTPQLIYTNSTAIGYNAEPDASNQVMLGDSNVTEVRTTGTVNAGGGFADNGVAGVDGSFVDNNGNTVTVNGGIITSLS